MSNEKAQAMVTEALIEIHKARASLKKAAELLSPITGAGDEHAKVSDLTSKTYWLWEEVNSGIDRNSIDISEYYKRKLAP